MGNLTRWSASIPALVLIGLIGCSRAEPGPVLPEDLPWTPFRWVTAVYPEFRLERAALLVPADVAGTRSLLQLDLAASGSMPFGYPRSESATSIRRKGQLYGLAMGAPMLESPPSPADSSALLPSLHEIGTMGLPMFERRTLLIDYRGGRFASLSGGTLPQSLEAATTFVPLEERNGRLTFTLETGDRAIGPVHLDTGLSPFPLWVGHDAWRELTGRSGTEESNLVRRLPSPAGELLMVGAPSARTIRIGGLDLGRPMVWFLRSGPPGAAPDRWPWRAEGVAGNLLFADRYILLVDLEHNRLGLIRRG